MGHNKGLQPEELYMQSTARSRCLHWKGRFQVWVISFVAQSLINSNKNNSPRMYHEWQSREVERWRKGILAERENTIFFYTFLYTP